MSLMGVTHEYITDIIKFREDEQEIWIYSTQNSGDLNRFRYYMLYLKNNVPCIIELDNAMNKIQEFHSEPEDINENSVEYIKFIAIKEYAEKILNKKKTR